MEDKKDHVYVDIKSKNSSTTITWTPVAIRQVIIQLVADVICI